jgi:hypothetical protein
VITKPPIFARLGVGAIVSPQALADADHRVVLDLANREVRIAEASSPPHSPAGKPEHDLPIVNVCNFRVSGFDAKALVVKAMIDGTPTFLEVDTGASSTFVVADSEEGRKLGFRTDATRAQATLHAANRCARH